MPISHPTATLSNGTRVANFSSPHPFTFTDDTVLGACDPASASSLNLDTREVETPHPTLAGVTDVELVFLITEGVAVALEDLNANDEVDVILVPFPVLDAIKRAGAPIGKARVIRSDRITKRVEISRFCR